MPSWAAESTMLLAPRLRGAPMLPAGSLTLWKIKQVKNREYLRKKTQELWSLT